MRWGRWGAAVRDEAANARTAQLPPTVDGGKAGGVTGSGGRLSRCILVGLPSGCSLHRLKPVCGRRSAVSSWLRWLAVSVAKEAQNPCRMPGEDERVPATLSAYDVPGLALLGVCLAPGVEPIRYQASRCDCKPAYLQPSILFFGAPTLAPSRHTVTGQLRPVPVVL